MTISAKMTAKWLIEYFSPKFSSYLNVASHLRVRCSRAQIDGTATRTAHSSFSTQLVRDSSFDIYVLCLRTGYQLTTIPGPEVQKQPKCSADGNVIEWLPSSPTRLHLACMSTRHIWICRAKFGIRSVNKYS